MLKKWIAPLHVCDFTEKLLHYHFLRDQVSKILVIVNLSRLNIHRSGIKSVFTVVLY